MKLLHMAPEKCLYDFISAKGNIEYTTIDLFPENFSYIPNILKANVLNLPFEDNSFDIILSNHVIEHIENEEAFLFELKRVLKDSGSIILTAPYMEDMKKTLELPEVKSKEERLKYYGQEDHVRLYGTDIIERLQKAFDLSHIKEEELLFNRSEPSQKLMSDCFVLKKKA